MRCWVVDRAASDVVSVEATPPSSFSALHSTTHALKVLPAPKEAGRSHLTGIPLLLLAKTRRLRGLLASAATVGSLETIVAVATLLSPRSPAALTATILKS